MSAPEITPEYVQCGPDLAPLLPTAYLKFEGRYLKQWFEASVTDCQGVNYTNGCWRPVPGQRS